MDAAAVIVTLAVGVGLGAALVVRVYAGISVAAAPDAVVGRVRDRLARARNEGAARVAALVVWAVVLTVVGWSSGVAIELITDGGSLGIVGWFATHRTAWLTGAMRVLTWLGDSTVVVPVLLSAGLLWRWRRGGRWALALLAVGYLGSSAIYNTVKFLVAASRPAGDLAVGVATGASFPSGHTANATVLGIGLVVVLLASGPAHRRDGIIAATAGALIAVVGVSRVYLGLHWAPDVVGGAVLGGLWLAGAVAVLGARPRDATLARPRDDERTTPQETPA